MMPNMSAKEMVAQRLRAQVDALPEDDPKRKLIAALLEDRHEEADAQREALRRIALERFHALQDGDPLKEVLGRVLAEGPAPTAPAAPPPPPPVEPSHAFRSDAWAAIHALQRGQESLFSAIKTIDARAAAAMQEAQRIAAKGVELQEYLNMVLEEVHQNTQMLRSFKDTFGKEK
jgi:hypothetical protein